MGMLFGVTTCFSTSDAVLGSARAWIWGSADNGSDNGNDFGRRRLREESDDLALLWLVYSWGIAGTLGAGASERRARNSLAVTVDVLERG